MPSSGVSEDKDSVLIHIKSINNSFKKKDTSRAAMAWWHTPLIPALRGRNPVDL
jgi:hypothetical protein